MITCRLPTIDCICHIILLHYPYTSCRGWSFAFCCTTQFFFEWNSFHSNVLAISFRALYGRFEPLVWSFCYIGLLQLFVLFLPIILVPFISFPRFDDLCEKFPVFSPVITKWVVIFFSRLKGIGYFSRFTISRSYSNCRVIHDIRHIVPTFRSNCTWLISSHYLTSRYHLSINGLAFSYRLALSNPKWDSTSDIRINSKVPVRWTA